MEVVKQTVQAINSYAQLQPSAFSNVNLDFVLNTGSYATTSNNDSTTASNATFDLLQCIPCEPDLAQSDNKRRLFTMLEQSASNGPHSINNMKTHYLRLSGKFILKKLEGVLDALLYGGSGGANHTSAVRNTASTTANATVPTSSAMDIFRMKGIVRTTESDVLYVLQAVHNIFDLQPSAYSVGDEGDLTQGDSVLVIIGKNLDMEYVESEFRRCIDSAIL